MFQTFESWGKAEQDAWHSDPLQVGFLNFIFKKKFIFNFQFWIFDLEHSDPLQVEALNF